MRQLLILLINFKYPYAGAELLKGSQPLGTSSSSLISVWVTVWVYGGFPNSVVPVGHNPFRAHLRPLENITIHKSKPSYKVAAEMLWLGVTMT